LFFECIFLKMSAARRHAAKQKAAKEKAKNAAKEKKKSAKEKKAVEIDEEERKQKELDDALLAACCKGSLDDVKKALANGGSINSVDKIGKNGLSLACEREDWSVAAQIVKFLLSKRFSAAMADNDGANAAHYAAKYSSAKLMKLLLETNVSLVHSKLYEENWTPLCLLCSNRFDDEAVRVASLLLDHGANIEQVCGKRDDTPLLLACKNGRADLVSLLLEQGANVHAMRKRKTALHLACENGAFGKEIIPLLVEAGAHVDDVDVLSLAISKGYDFGKAVMVCFARTDKPKVWASMSDPIGAMTLHRELGKEMPSSKFARNVDEAPEWAWACLRSGALLLDESSDDAFNALESCEKVKLWIWASREPGFQQHPTTGETVLHLLARSDALTTEQKLEVLAELKKDFRNPLIPNFENQRAVDLTSDPLLMAELLKYMEFRAEKMVMRWYGPLFRQRVFTMLLVLKRLNVAANKDIRKLLAKYMSEVEHIYVPQKL
jgi:ankyrin repeat protein